MTKNERKILVYFYTIVEIFQILKVSCTVDRDKCRRGIKRKAIIMGNGPSLDVTLSDSKEKLKEFDVFCVNEMVHSEVYDEIKPRNYVILDPGYFTSNLNKNGNGQEHIHSTLEKIKSKTKWDLNIFLPHASKKYKFLPMNFFNDNITIRYFYNVPLRGLLKNYAAKMNAGILGGQNVLHAALTIAINMGYEEILIVGADHSWFEDIKWEKYHSYLVDKHFYDSGIEKKELHKEKELGNGFVALGNCLLSYYDIDQYSKFRNVIIKNASERSYIDAFPFTELNIK